MMSASEIDKPAQYFDIVRRKLLPQVALREPLPPLSLDVLKLLPTKYRPHDQEHDAGGRAEGC